MPHAREQFWLVAYDVANDRVRYRVERLLSGVGERQQFSVFGCWLDRRALGRLKSRLGQLIDRAGDSIRFYPLCRPCWHANRQRNVPLPDPLPDHWEV